jgi:hypothetical protein
MNLSKIKDLFLLSKPQNKRPLTQLCSLGGLVTHTRRALHTWDILVSKPHSDLSHLRNVNCMANHEAYILCLDSPLKLLIANVR